MNNNIDILPIDILHKILFSNLKVKIKKDIYNINNLIDIYLYYKNIDNINQQIKYLSSEFTYLNIEKKYSNIFYNMDIPTSSYILYKNIEKKNINYDKEIMFTYNYNKDDKYQNTCRHKLILLK
jgi:hypothetical protein